MMVYVLHKDLEWKEKKIKCMKLGGHAANQHSLSFLNFVEKNMKGGGEGLINFLSQKGGLISKGGLIEDLRHIGGTGMVQR